MSHSNILPATHDQHPSTSEMEVLAFQKSYGRLPSGSATSGYFHGITLWLCQT